MYRVDKETWAYRAIQAKAFQAILRLIYDVAEELYQACLMQESLNRDIPHLPYQRNDAVLFARQLVGFVLEHYHPADRGPINYSVVYGDNPKQEFLILMKDIEARLPTKEICDLCKIDEDSYNCMRTYMFRRANLPELLEGYNDSQ
jgi:hypothetical protein